MVGIMGNQDIAGLTYQKENGAVDFAKCIFAIMVIGIHTQPFAFNDWLDRGFGIITRLCVPYFFVIGSYFFFKAEKNNLKKYLGKLLRLYVIWSFVYLPFSLQGMINRTFLQNIKLYFWSGNDFALWYLWGTVIATLTVWILIKIFEGHPGKVITCSFVLFLIGIMGSTWSPLLLKFGGGVLHKDC